MRVGLTGGIGSGKSTVAARLASLGAVVIDYDRLAREVVAAGTTGFHAVRDAFGDGVVGDDGELDRAALAAVVFGDAAERARLNAIVHPLVGARAAEIEAAAAVGSIVVHEIPLLVENGLAPAFEAVVVVLVSDSQVQLGRLVARGMAEEDARARLAAQATAEQRRAVATHLLVNDAGVPELDAQVERVWRDLSGTVASR